MLKRIVFGLYCVIIPTLVQAQGPDVQVLAKTILSWDGAKLPNYPQGQPEITILRITIPAGMKLSMHRHPVINAGVLLRGVLSVHTPDGQSLELKKGDQIVELVDRWHYGENTGDEPAEIIVFYAGLLGEPITVLEK